MAKKPDPLQAYIALLAYRAAKKFQDPAMPNWLREATKMADVEREIRKAIRAALRAKA